ncbi:SUKH-4 family immunity protein [Streptomyces celluloflavus]|uniref:SUKH-4 family immunity protein n=1 Tax=Streptomyces celluloflavus TaxID=58344 RepID=UPI00345F25AB|nr:SUKH-4 family immunity protein [Streptomyces celluloflavus]
MVTFAQAQERAEQWVNGDVPATFHREVRVREFDLGFVVWAEDRADGPQADGGRSRLVIARDSGETTLWPGLPVGEVIRRYEEEYGAVPDGGHGAAEPPQRIDLEATSFLLTPPEWLQEVADAIGTPDRPGEGAAAPGPPAAPAPAPAAAAGDAGPADTTPWAAADTTGEAGDEDRSVGLPATVFAPPLTGLDGTDGGTPQALPEAKTALLRGGGQLPRTEGAAAVEGPGVPAPEVLVAGGPGGPGGWPGSGAPAVPPMPVAPPGARGLADLPPPSGPPVLDVPPPEGVARPVGAGAPGGPGPGVPPGSGPGSGVGQGPGPGLPLPSGGGVHAAATMMADGAAVPGRPDGPPPPPGVPGPPGVPHGSGGPGGPGVPGATGPADASDVPGPAAAGPGGSGAAAGGYVPTQLVSQVDAADLDLGAVDGPGAVSAPGAGPVEGDAGESGGSGGPGAPGGSDGSHGSRSALDADGVDNVSGVSGAGGVDGVSSSPASHGADVAGAGGLDGAPSAGGAAPVGGAAPTGGVHAAATMFADGASLPGNVAGPGGAGADAGPGVPPPPAPPGAPKPPGVPGVPPDAVVGGRGSGGQGGPPPPPPAPEGAPGGGVHAAATMLAGGAAVTGGPGGPVGAGGAGGPGGAGVPGPPGPGMPPSGGPAGPTPGAPTGPPGPSGPVPGPPGAPGPSGPGGPGGPGAYGYPQASGGLPTVGPGYMAVLSYRAPDGSEQKIVRRSAPGTPHPEWQLLHELRGLNIPPQQVLELHTELECCDLPGGYCARMIRETWPQVRISHTAAYGGDHAARQQGVRRLVAHQGELHQVADGPARPAPVRVPLPHPSQVPPTPPAPPQALGQELEQSFGPQGIFRFDQRAVSRQGVPDAVAQTLVWAGLPVDFGPFFWAQAQPGRPVPTLAELAAERRVQPAPDAGSYLVMGNDFGRQLCVQYGTANIVAVPLEADAPNGGRTAAPQFVNTGLPEFVRCLAMLGRMWRLRYGLTPEQAGRWTVDFQAQLVALDPPALGSPETWWSVLLEQMWDGLL